MSLGARARSRAHPFQDTKKVLVPCPLALRDAFCSASLASLTLKPRPSSSKAARTAAARLWIGGEIFRSTYRWLLAREEEGWYTRTYRTRTTAVVGFHIEYAKRNRTNARGNGIDARRFGNFPGEVATTRRFQRGGARRAPGVTRNRR